MFNRFMHAPRDSSTPRRDSYDWRSDYSPSSKSTKIRGTFVCATIPQPRIKHSASLQLAWQATASKTKKRVRGRRFTRLRALISILALTYGAWYRQVRKDIGFCTPYNPSTTPMDGTGMTSLNSERYVLISTGPFLWETDTSIPFAVWHHFYPKCIPCPENAICLQPKRYPQCHNYYTLKLHPLSFNGRLPIAPICVLNWTPELQSIHVADFAEKILRMRAGEEDCKTFQILPKSSPDLMLRQRISSQELKNEIMRHKDVSVDYRVSSEVSSR